MQIFRTLSSIQPSWCGMIHLALFDHSTQQDDFKLAPKKLAVGFKYVDGKYAGDFMFDAISVSYSSSLTYLVGLVLICSF